MHKAKRAELEIKIQEKKAECFDLIKKQAVMAADAQKLTQQQNAKAREIADLEKQIEA